MFDIKKVFRFSKILKSWVNETQAQGHELEEILMALQNAVQSPNKYDVEVRCWAAGAAVVVVDMINAEREADGCGEVD